MSGEQATIPKCTSGLARRVLGIALPVASVATAVLAPLLTWSHLPDPLAVHFSVSGGADGTLSRLGALILGVGLSVLGGAGMVWATRFRFGSSWTNPVAFRAGLGVAAFMGGLGAALEVSLVIANYDAQNWSLAEFPSYALIVTLALPVILGLAAYVLAGRLPIDY